MKHRETSIHPVQLNLANRWLQAERRGVLKLLETHREFGKWIGENLSQLGETESGDLDLRGLTFDSYQFVEFSPNGCSLNYCSFTNCVFVDANLSFARTSDANFVGCTIFGTPEI